MHGGCCRDRLIKAVSAKKDGRRKNAMAKVLEVNDHTPRDQERQPQQQSGDKCKQRDVQGKALQMNDNSVGGKEPARSPALPRQGSGEKPKQQTFKARLSK
jgi:hypothetical protein